MSARYSTEDIEDLSLTDKDDTWKDWLSTLIAVGGGAILIVAVAAGFAMHKGLI